MRRLSLLSGAALLLAAGGAQAQMTDGNRSHPVAPLGVQQQAARQLDSAGQRDATTFLSQAERAVSRGDWARANEFVERAQTTLLNTPGMDGRAQNAGQMGSLADAHRAIMGRDRGEAQRALQAAMASVGGGAHGRSGYGADAYTGAGAGGGMPAQGGSQGYADPRAGGPYGGPSVGGTTMRDQGMGGRSMARADLILAQAGGGGGGGAGGGAGEQSGGLQSSTPGSPGAGQLGSTPQSTLGLGQQPAQGAAVPLAPDQGGRAAPVPGSNVTVPGGTGVMPGDQRRGPPAPGQPVPGTTR